MSCITIQISKTLFIEFYFNQDTKAYSAKLLFKFKESNTNWLYLNLNNITIKKLKRAIDIVNL